MPALRSIRVRLLTGILLSLIATLAVVAVASYRVTLHESEEIFSARLATSARVLEALMAKQLEHATVARPLVIELPQELEHATGDNPTRYGHPYETKIAFQVWHRDGALLARSASAPETAFGPNVAGFSEQRIGGEPWQVFALRAGEVWIQVAEKDEVRSELIENLGFAVMTPTIIGSAVLLLLVYVLVGFGLRPLSELSARIATREPGTLGPIELPAVPDEIAPVVHALNDLLARVRRALEHERRFTDAAAHELRTPLAALKLHAENAARAGGAEERRVSILRLRQCVDRTSRLAEQMLAYSRTQATDERTPAEPVDLHALAAETIRAQRGALPERAARIALAAPGSAACLIRADPDKLRLLLRNLLENAIRYGDPGGAVTVGVMRAGATIVLTVANAGPPIPAELRQRVFEPYYRLPGSPSDGSGLGLAIVKEIADQHGATVRIEDADANGGTCVRVEFPAV